MAILSLTFREPSGLFLEQSHPLRPHQRFMGLHLFGSLELQIPNFLILEMSGAQYIYILIYICSKILVRCKTGNYSIDFLVCLYEISVVSLSYKIMFIVCVRTCMCTCVYVRVWACVRVKVWRQSVLSFYYVGHNCRSPGLASFPKKPLSRATTQVSPYVFRQKFL